MNNMYVEALYNENRNAIPSWQGYHYQAQAATHFFLKYILNCFNNNQDNMDNISMKIEWMEDFIIFEKNTIKQVYQVKKTLNNADYTDVIQNFMLQHKIIEDTSCQWIVVYDSTTSEDYISVSEEKYNTLYENYILNLILNEVNLLRTNRDNPGFWTDNLKLKFAESQLFNIRHYIINLMNNFNLARIGLNNQQCDEFTGLYIEPLIEKLTRNDGDYQQFNLQLHFENLEINLLQDVSNIIVRELISREFLRKSDIMLESEIVECLYGMIYKKLMNVENRKNDTFIITFNDVKDVFLCTEKSRILWEKQVYQAREGMVENISLICSTCVTRDCKECTITKFLNLDFCQVIENCNLEYPRLNPEYVLDALTKKLSPEKYRHLIDILFKYKSEINCIEDTNYIELQHGLQKMFVSQNIADDCFVKGDLINNIPEHLEVYKEYKNILTRYFQDTIDYEDLKVLKDLEQAEKVFDGERKQPKFMDILPINFISKNCLEEE